ncbi:tail protein [Paraglaciecola Antarctic JLT virus 2]|nr:tail protein [Paraglaciecola Antarctic JLT virus 2]
MSYLDTKQALLTKLLATSITGITTADIDFENSDLIPFSKTKYLSASFLPASSDTTGKELNARQERRGIFQVSIFIKLNGGSYDNDQLQIVDDLEVGFAYGSTATYNEKTVSILESSINNGRESGAWYQRDFSVVYLTIY